MRTCIIFNPAAKGEKARRFLAQLDAFARECTLLRTHGPDEARLLARRALVEGHDTLVAAGGDGTLNEVLNGLAEAPEGLRRARLGLLPLGTVNVFARELGIPRDLGAAWNVIQRGGERTIDLPCIETVREARTSRRYFAQLAGAGLDAAAIARVNWRLKKFIGPLAYVVAGLQALVSPHPCITVTAGTQAVTGRLVLIGNGRRYGGEFHLFPQADCQDGLLDVCVFPRVNWWQLMRCSGPLLWRHRVPESLVRRLRAAEFTLTAAVPVPFEVEGELAGELPATVSVRPAALRVLVP